MKKYVLAVLAALSLSPAMAEDTATYPTRTITFVVPTPPGGPTDIGARLLAERLAPRLGKAIIVENRAGASQTLGTAAVVKASPDGYKLLFTGSGPIVISPNTMKSVTYDVLQDLKIVARVASLPLVLYVDAKLPIKSLQDLVEMAKREPGRISYGSFGTGSSAHLLGEYMNKTLGINLVHVPYAGISPEIQDLIGGHINVAIADVASPAEYARAGTIRPIAITGSARVPAFPDVPTFAEQGVGGGMEIFSAWWGLFAPARTPDDIIRKLADATLQVTQSAEFRDRLTSLGVTPAGAIGEEAEAFLQSDVAKWRKTIAELPSVTKE